MMHVSDRRRRTLVHIRLRDCHRLLAGRVRIVPCRLSRVIDSWLLSGWILPGYCRKRGGCSSRWSGIVRRRGVLHCIGVLGVVIDRLHLVWHLLGLRLTLR